MNKIIATILLAALGLSSGCATTGYQRAKKAESSMTALSQSLISGREQVTQTLSALNKLVDAREGDLIPAFKMYEREVANLGKSGQSANRLAATMQGKTAVYFEQWKQEIETIQNPGIRTESTRRLNEAMKSYRQIEGPAKDAAAAYDPLLQDLRDIQAHLRQDLTARGIEGVRPLAEQATQDAAALRARIAEVVKEIERVAREMNTLAETGQ